jgi:hypothetical protein
MTRQNWRYLNFVLSSDTLYCGIFFFANRIESTKFIVNFTWKHLHGDWNQIPAKRTNTKMTAWLQTPPDPTIGATITSFAFIAIRVTTVRTWFKFYRTKGALVQSNMTDIGYYNLLGVRATIRGRTKKYHARRIVNHSYGMIIKHFDIEILTNFMMQGRSWKLDSCPEAQWIPYFWKTLRSITVFTDSRHWILSWASRIHSTLLTLLLNKDTDAWSQLIRMKMFTVQ